MARRYKTSMNASCSVMCFPLGLLESDLVERLSHEILGLGLVPAPQPQHGVKEGVRVARRAQPCVVIGDEGQGVQTERGEQLAPAHEHDHSCPGQVERERVFSERPCAGVAEQVDERKRLDECRYERWNEEQHNPHQH